MPRFRCLVARALFCLPLLSSGPLAAQTELEEAIAAREKTAIGPEDPRLRVEDARVRAEAPEWIDVPAARPEELTPALDDAAGSARSVQWVRSHGDDGCSRWSPLAQITRENVKQLAVAWTYRSGDGAGNIQCNPVIVDGTMYAPTVGEHVVAVDAATGQEKWRFRPGTGRPAHRGLVFWRGNAEQPSRILFTAGKALFALDASTGQPIPGFGENGRAPMPMSSTVAPAVFEDVIVLAGFDRDVFGYDLRTGKERWRFHTVPQAGEPGAETWDAYESGANCWGGIALDAQRGIVFVPTGSPKPNFVGTGHRGRNLYANCLIALDARTGARRWHFQELRHDIWDLDLPAPPVLVTVERDGRKVDAVAQVTKVGNTLLLDRVTGAPLFPYRLRRAPVSPLPGERTWPYQPVFSLPEPFARQEWTRDDVTDVSPEARAYIQGRIASARFGWYEPFEEGRPTVLYGIHGGAEWTGAAADRETGWLYVSSNEVPWIVTVFRTDETPRDPKQSPTAGELLYIQHCAACHGADRVGVGVAPPLQGLRHRMTDEQVTALLQTGRNLMPPAPQLSEQDRRQLLDFLFLRDRPQPISADKKDRAAPPRFAFNGYNKLLDQENYPGSKPPWGTLNAIDLNTGKLMWKVPLGEYEELSRRGIPKTGTENFGGATVTAGGLVFCAGTRDLKLRAFDKKTGEELWSHPLPFGGFAPPATYEAGDRQYVVIAATGGGKLGGKTGDAYVAFALPEPAAGSR
jgi:quinoprotein glucose dehydrogenase